MIRTQPHPELMLCDLHVHTKFSPSHTFKVLDARDCYSHPDAVYAAAKRRGMDLVTFTDHDTIDGCLFWLDRHGERPDFFISEEVETYLPGMRGRIHVNVFDLDEQQHREIQRHRASVFDLVPYLKREGLLFALNHIFRCNRRDRARMTGLMDRLFEAFDCFEVRNGSQLRVHNEFWMAAVERCRAVGVKKAVVGGSDAHTLRRVGTTYTGALARSKRGFLAAAREGRTFVEGDHGHFFGTTFDAVEVVLRYTKNVCIDNEERFPLPRRMRHVAVATAMLPLCGVISGVTTAINMRRQTTTIDALCRGSRDWDLSDLP